jgi:hypothetical protein
MVQGKIIFVAQKQKLRSILFNLYGSCKNSQQLKNVNRSKYTPPINDKKYHKYLKIARHSLTTISENRRRIENG